jgi:hypothetical protein
MAGRLDGEGVGEARRALGDLGRVREIEASELVAADAAGLALLAELRAAGARLSGLSPYLSLRLAELTGAGNVPEKGEATEQETKRTSDNHHTKEAGKK